MPTACFTETTGTYVPLCCRGILTVPFFVAGDRFLICRQQCLNSGAAHYHCYCGMVNKRLCNVKKHVQQCGTRALNHITPEMKDTSENSPNDITQSVNPKLETETIEIPSQASQQAVMDTEPTELTVQLGDDGPTLTIFVCNQSATAKKDIGVQTVKTLDTVPNKANSLIKCNLCAQLVSRKNYKRHLKNHSDRNTSLQSCCVGANLYLVEKYGANGSVQPTHVKLKIHENNMECTEQLCKDLALAVGKPQNFLCPHLTSAMNTPSEPKAMDLPCLETVITLSSHMKTSLTNLKKDAEKHNSPLVVKWPFSHETLYFSVYSGVQEPWSPLGRTLVVQDAELRCPCGKEDCVHVAAVQWAGYQVAPEPTESSQEGQEAEMCPSCGTYTRGNYTEHAVVLDQQAAEGL